MRTTIKIYIYGEPVLILSDKDNILMLYMLGLGWPERKKKHALIQLTGMILIRAV